MNPSTYTYPVNELLTLGETSYMGEWLDYRKLGLTPKDVPELLRMIADETLILVEDDDSPELLAIVHAARALGQLRAEEAIEPLLSLLDRLGQDDLDEWTMDDYPQIFGLIGPAAIPALVAYMKDPAHSLYTRSTAADCLAEVGKNYPETRVECVAAVTDQLARLADNDPQINDDLVVSLLTLEARESLPVIEQAFEGGYMEEALLGWRDVQDGLGLPGYRDDLATWVEPTPRKQHSLQGVPPSKSRPKVKTRAQEKAKRKQAEKSRKVNRKRK